jgi:hypothetical protein
VQVNVEATAGTLPGSISLDITPGLGFVGPAPQWTAVIQQVSAAATTTLPATR